MILRLFISSLVLTVWSVTAQVVNVTALLETNRIAVGASTVLHVYGQIAPERQADADQIFSWDLDLENSTPLVAKAQFNSLSKPASDKDPRLSSNGVADGANLRGIYDTFLNLPGAGLTNRVELFRLQVTGVSTGKTVFAIRPGSIPNLEDFLVASKEDIPPLIGGIYTTNALAVLTVAASTNVVLPDIKLRIAATNGLPVKNFVLSFNAPPGPTYTLEYRDRFGTGTWLAFPGAPHNSGLVLETNNAAKRFYRVRISP